jgi:hypothetical protein
MLFFWVFTPCRIAGRCQHFGETYCLHLLLDDRDSMFLRTLTATYESRRRENPEEHHHRRSENLKSHPKNLLAFV